MPQTTALWMMDSSALEWPDTIRLSVNLPRRRWPIFLQHIVGEDIDDHYEGLPAQGVMLGGRQVAGTPSLDVEAEWAILFDRPLAQLESIGAETPCTLQGMIDVQRLDLLAEESDPNFADVALNAPVLARGRGIPATLGVLGEGSTTLARACATAMVPLANGEVKVSQARAHDLAALPIVEIIRAVAEEARARNMDLRGVHVSAKGELNALAGLADCEGNAPREYLAPVLRQLIQRNADQMPGLIRETRRALARERIAGGLCLRPGAPVLLSVADGNGIQAGEAALLLVPDDSE